MIRIGIAEDQALVRESLAVVLNLESDLTVVWTASTGGEALRKFAAAPVDVLLLDLRLPDLDGVTVLRRLGSGRGEADALILTTFPHDEWLLEALHAGAAACFSKEVPPDLLVGAIRQIRSGRWDPEAWAPDWRRYAPEIQFRVRAPFEAQRPAGEGLTPREIDILRRICGGGTNGEIAAAMGLTEGTVKNYVSQLYAKLGVRHRAGAIAAARAHGVW